MGLDTVDNGRGRRLRRTRWLTFLSIFVAWAFGPVVSAMGQAGRAETNLRNLAANAVITASGALNHAYHPRHVADGVIPEQGCRQDTEAAWCLPQAVAAKAWLRLQWPEPVPVACIVYWGRTAWLDNENFAACEVLTDLDAAPLISRALARGPSPQVMILPDAIRMRSVILRFPSHYGGPNPGAAEIGVFATVPTIAELEAYPDRPWQLAPNVLQSIRRGDYGFTRLLAVQRRELNPTHVYTYHQESLLPGGGLWIHDFSRAPVETRRILDSSEGVILDAQVHYDGGTILFSWKRTMEDFFQLYTIGIDGGDLRQLTRHPSNNFNACWLPDGGIVFLSDRKPAFAYCWQTTTPILWRCNGDGGEPTRISANYLNDFTPSVMQDGRVLYSRWEYVDRPAIPIQSLWSINPDGTMLQGVFGNRVLSPATFMDAREIPGGQGRILCTLTAHNGPCRGAIGLIDPRQGANSQAGIVNLTPEVKIGQVNKGDGNSVRGPYLHPWPLDEQWYLVSRAGSIQLRDYAGRYTEVLLPRQGVLGFYNPQPVQPRRREYLIPSRENAESVGDWAVVMMQDVYSGLGAAAPRGTIKQIAVIQEVEKPLGISPERRAFGFQFPVVSCGATYAPKKVWGHATVDPDGSAHFKVPAQQPIYFLPLDAEGRAVQRMRTFTHLMPGETQSCVGCHAERNDAVPVAGSMTAARRPAEPLQEPEWGLRGFSYAHIVQPVWDRHCIDCHGRQDPAAGLDLTGDRTDFFNVSYEHLVRKGTSSEPWWIGGVGGTFRASRYTSWIPTYNGQEANILEIAPGRWGARASRLAAVIRDGHRDEQGVARVELADWERRRVYAWLDLNCPYYGTSDSNYRHLRGCRQQLPPDFTIMMKDVGARRCAACHEKAGTDENWVFGLPNSFYVRIDSPELNSFLRAPLARAGGGSQKCGAAVFADTDDPDYRRLLQSFTVLQEQLHRNPRVDMVPPGDPLSACSPSRRDVSCSQP